MPSLLEKENNMALEAFLRQNKKERETIKFPASKAFVDENGKPIDWTIRPLTSREAENIRKQVNRYRKGGTVEVDNALFNRKVAATCTVYPDLKNAELQDSYGVMGEEELIVEMLDNDGEYQTYVAKCLEVSGYNQSETELVEEAKN